MVFGASGKRCPRGLPQPRGNGQPRRSWLQRSLKTKDRREARQLAPPVFIALPVGFSFSEGATFLVARPRARQGRLAVRHGYV
jgi:hypothetical protein